MMALIAEKPYETVTVQDVIDRADVSRSTFYAHFTDKDHLLIEAFRDLRDRYRAEVFVSDHRDEPFGWSRYEFAWHLRMMLEFPEGDGSRCPLTGFEECALLVHELERELEVVVRQDLANMAAIPTAQVPDVVIRFVVHCFMSLSASWLNDPQQYSVDEIDQLFHTLAVPGAAAALGVDVDSSPQRSIGRSLSAV